MRYEEKELLLKDICGRIPYHPKGLVVNACTGAECEEWLSCSTFTMFTSVMNNCRLYLRPMSSMTEAEKEELNSLCYHNIDVQDGMLCGYVCAGEMTAFIRNVELQQKIVKYLQTHDYGNVGEIEKIYRLCE